MIEVRSGRDGARVYRARVYHRGRYVASRTFARKRDAQEWERRQVDGLRSGVWSDPGAAERPVQDGAIPRNPAAGIRLPKVQGNEPQPLTHTELWQLAEQFDSRRDRVLIVVAGYCGLRWGELAALRWTDIDLDLRRLRVSRAYSEEAPRGEMSPVKDHQARTVPIPRTVVDELTKLQAQSAPSELVFPSANSTPLRNRNFRRDSFDAATAALGLTITPHNLRDTAASLAIQAGASVVAVARLLGHESAATTLNHYAGLFPTDLDDVAVRLDAAAREAVGDQ